MRGTGLLLTICEAPGNSKRLGTDGDAGIDMDRGFLLTCCPTSDAPKAHWNQRDGRAA